MSLPTFREWIQNTLGISVEHKTTSKVSKKNQIIFLIECGYLCVVNPKLIKLIFIICYNCFNIFVLFASLIGLVRLSMGDFLLFFSITGVEPNLSIYLEIYLKLLNSVSLSYLNRRNESPKCQFYVSQVVVKFK